MQKVVSFLFVFFSIITAGCSSAQTKHLDELKRKFPYGLIGNDYGILNEDDLATNTCNVTEVEPFPPKDISPYPYWQFCGVKDVALVCDDSGFDEDEKSIMSILDLKVRSKEGKPAKLLLKCCGFEPRWSPQIYKGFLEEIPRTLFILWA
jgi:hypothetical protein